MRRNNSSYPHYFPVTKRSGCDGQMLPRLGVSPSDTCRWDQQWTSKIKDTRLLACVGRVAWGHREGGLELSFSSDGGRLLLDTTACGRGVTERAPSRRVVVGCICFSLSLGRNVVVQFQSVTSFRIVIQFFDLQVHAVAILYRRMSRHHMREPG
jgi:hypothetical protein